MAFDINERPQRIEEMSAYVSSAIVAAGRGRQSLTSNASALAAMVAHLYNYMGADDLAANAKGSEILREAQKIDAAITDIMGVLKVIRDKTKAAAAEYADHETKRRSARAKIG